jgi:hypothetical protein
MISFSRKEIDTMSDGNGKYTFSSFIVACGLMLILFLSGVYNRSDNDIKAIEKFQISSSIGVMVPLSKINVHFSNFYSPRLDISSHFEVTSDVSIFNPDLNTAFSFGYGSVEATSTKTGELVIGLSIILRICLWILNQIYRLF